MKDVAVIIVAAGSGSRYGRPKQFELLGREPLVVWPIRAFLKASAVREVILVHALEQREEMIAILTHAKLIDHVRLVDGGATRQQSTANGVREVSSECLITLVHDAARALIDVETIEQVIAGCRKHQAALVAVPVVDTIKEAEEDHLVKRTIPRINLWRAQTPQGAKTELLKQAITKAVEDYYYATDESEILERIGIQPLIIHGKESNFKITYPEDLERAEHFLVNKLSL